MIKKPSSSPTLLHPPRLDPSIDAQKEEAAKKICHLMREFQLRKKGFHTDLKYMRENIYEPKTEKMLMNFLQRQYPFIEVHLPKESPASAPKNAFEFFKYITEAFLPKKPQPPVQKGVLDLFKRITETFDEKEFRITGVKEGLYGRKIPEVNIVSKKCLSGTSLQFLPDGTSHNNTQGRWVQSKAEADYLVKSLFQIKEIPWEYPFSNCAHKATAICQLLEHMEIPKHTLKKVWVMTEEGDYLNWDSEKDMSKQYNLWNWHIAPILTTKNEKKYVIDPSVNATQALSLQDWKNALKAKKNVECKETELIYSWPLEDPTNYQKAPPDEIKAAHATIYFQRLLNQVPFESSTRQLLHRPCKRVMMFDEDETGSLLKKIAKKEH